MNGNIALSVLHKLNTDGFNSESALGRIDIEHHQIGYVDFPSGKVVACDPHVVHKQDRPFSKDITPGPHLVYICVARITPSKSQAKGELSEVDLLANELAEMILESKGVDQSKSEESRDVIAAAILKIGEDKPVSWVPASIKEKNAGDQDQEKLYRYMVDSGTGSFMDPVTKTKLLDLYKEDANYHNILNELMEENYSSNFSWSIPVLDNDNGLNFAMFTSGEGDGDYASYWGYDKNNKLACLITDFGILKV